MLFSKPLEENVFAHGAASTLVTAFQYRPMVQPAEVQEQAEAEQVQDPGVRITEELFAQRLAEERALGSTEAESRAKRDYEQKLSIERAKIVDSIRGFEQTRKEYFVTVEAEVVQLALAIAKKILHREAQVDPLLITALVQIALGQIKEGSVVTMRVHPGEASRWRERLSTAVLNVDATVVEDSERSPGDCVLETELGSVNFSLEAQLKEVEQGFLDVLARTPQL